MINTEIDYSEAYECFCELSNKILSHELHDILNNKNDIERENYSLRPIIYTDMITLKNIKSLDDRNEFYKKLNINSETIDTVEKIYKILIKRAQKFVDNDNRNYIEDKDIQEFMFFVDKDDKNRIEINGIFEYDKNFDEYHFKCIEIYSEHRFKFYK